MTAGWALRRAVLALAAMGLAALGLAALGPAALAGPARAAEPARAPAAARAEDAEPAVAAEARRFMADYRLALLAGDRAGLAARYSLGGAYVVGGGRNTLEPPAATAAFYAGPQWQPPEAFSWNGLAYEALGPDAVLVTGTFTWDPKGEAAAMTVAYTAVLRRDADGVLRIRLEHE